LDLGPVVARVAEVPIFAGEVSAQAARSATTPRAALDQLIAFHLLAERSRERQPWPPAAGATERLRKEVLVQRLLERELEPHLRPEDISDPELRVLYDRARVSFVHPRLVEVGTLEVTVGTKATPEVRAAARETMTALKQVVDGLPGRAGEDLQKLSFDEKWRKRRVRYFHFLQGPDEPHSATFGAAVAKMAAKPGETIGVLEDERGFYLARYLGDRPAKNQPFEEVRAELRAGYYSRWRQQKFLDFVEQVSARHQVEVRSTTTGPPGG
jgi:hypothetical protein